MNCRKFRTTLQLSSVILMAVALYLYHSHVASVRQPAPPKHQGTHTSPLADLDVPSHHGKLPGTTVSRYVKSILDPEDTQLPRLDCPRPDLSRYEYLNLVEPGESGIRYFFALNLRECLPLLPRLIGSIVEAIRFLGPGSCEISVVEGNSPDGTGEVLAALQPELDKLLDGRVHFVLSNDIDPLEGEGTRFKKLAELRNMALQPMLGSPDQHLNATVVFINDVAICLDDILELIHQRRYLDSDMTCALDWVPGGGNESIFYDSYIARSLIGDLFFNIPPETASYSLAADLFWNEPEAQARFASHQPFQVFSCWNGAVAFTATPVVEGKVAFRQVFDDRGECFQAEPQLFCKDMWFQGHGKIAVIPTVNLAYSNEDGKRIKGERGYTSQWTSGESRLEQRIEWESPPAQVKCMPTFTDQTWRPWNEALVE